MARYLFVPMAEAVVFAMLASYFFSRTLVPTLAKYLLHVRTARRRPPGQSRWNPLARVHRAFERGFGGIRGSYRGLLKRCDARADAVHGAVPGLGCSYRRRLLPFVGRDFFPTVDAGQFKLHLRAKTGTRIEETARLCDLVEAEMRAHHSGRASWPPSSTTSGCR